jgi:O-antigen/teichoic acid export membrane protein
VVGTTARATGVATAREETNVTAAPATATPADPANPALGEGSAPAARGRLRAKMLRGSFFEIGGYGAQQVLRLASNLILTRLLFPAAFGLAALVMVLMTGLVMISDVALCPCVVQSKRGDDPDFLNTAFTIQVLRGLGLALLMFLLARPAAWFYREPALAPLVALGSLQLVFNGLHSTSIFTLRRELRLGWVNGLELGQSLIAIPLTVLLSWIYRSPWALVTGGVVGAACFAVASHFLPVPYRNRFQWDKAAAHEIRLFSRWVLGSSTATFLGQQADRILLGKFLGAAWLGIYGVAANLGDAASAVVGRVISGVLYPVLSEANRTGRPDFADFYYRLRLRLDLFSMSVTGFLAGAGGWIITTLWDRRYADAAWIFQVLCVRAAFWLWVSPGETVLFSAGHTRYGFQRSATRLVGAVLFISLGYHFGGVRGLVWGTVATEASTLLAIWPKLRELGLLRLRRELLAVAVFALACLLGVAVRHVLPEVNLRAALHRSP